MSERTLLYSKVLQTALVVALVAVIAYIVWDLVELRQQLEVASVGTQTDDFRLLAPNDQFPAVSLLANESSGSEALSIVPTRGVAVVSFLKTSCAACQATQSKWAIVANEVLPRGGSFLSISYSPESATGAYVQEHSVTWPVLRPTDRTSVLELGVKYVPQTVLVVDGRVSRIWNGVLTDDDVVAIVSDVEDALPLSGERK